MSPGLSFRGSRHRARRNRDGWGLAALSPQRTRITKEPIGAEESAADWEADLDEEKKPDQRGYVIASRPLTDGEDWTACRPGRLLVIERGTASFGV